MGTRILALRKQRRICQKEFAEYLHVSISTISNYENNVHEPDLPALVMIADYFNVSIDYLLGRTEYTYPFSDLETQKIDTYSCSSILNAALHLTDDSQTDLVKYLAMLELRDRTQGPLVLN